MSAGLGSLEQALGYRFRQPELLQRALTHRSHGAVHNERLEFLGDAVLNLTVSLLLYEQHAESDEGKLTRMRAYLVREDSLYRMALSLDLPHFVRLSEAEARSGGAQRPSILADAMEAVVAAVHLDGGFDAARQTVRSLVAPLLAAAGSGAAKDAKTALQEFLQARRLAVPSYRIVATRGDAHDQTFEVECAVAPLAVVARALGRSRRAAEQEAARKALDQLSASSRVPPP